MLKYFNIHYCFFEASVNRDRRQLEPRSELPEQFNFNIFVPATGGPPMKNKRKTIFQAHNSTVNRKKN